MNVIKDNFKGPKDTSYGVAGSLNYDEIDIFLGLKGYEKEKEFSKGRYYILKVTREKTPYLFKMSSSEGINFTLLNEKSWNEAMYKRALEVGFLRIPQVFESGNIGGFEFIITEFFEGERHVDILDQDIEKNLGSIIKANLFIDSQKDIFTYKNELEDKNEKAIKAVRERADKYFEVAENFMKEIEKYDVGRLLDFVRGYENMDEIGLNHNEFEPFNYIVSDGTIKLYHGERASARSPRFFDVAVMYSKLFYTYKRPEIAGRYLELFLKDYEKSGLEYFKKSFETMLASRLIGGYWDYCRNYENDIDLLEKLKEKLLRSEIFKF